MMSMASCRCDEDVRPLPGHRCVHCGGWGSYYPAYPTAETRVTDPVTGGEKGSKLPQLGAVCPRALLELAKVAGFGATKYARFNFLKGYAWSLSADALQRHLLAFLDGEDRDPESGCLHVAHVAWHGLALCAFILRGKGTDDRVGQ